MNNVFLQLERILVDAKTEMLSFAEELGRSEWAGRESEAAMRAVEISKRLNQATALLFSCDGMQSAPPASFNFQ